MQGNVNVIQSPYFFQRPNSPKGTLNHNSSSKNVSLSLSIGANQNPQQLIPFQKMKSIQGSPAQIPNDSQQELTFQRLLHELKISSKENHILREENNQLRRELLRLRRQPNFQNSRSLQKISLSPDVSDLRGTIKKEMGQLKDLRSKVQTLNSQCKINEEMIEKMQQRIKKLSIENDKKRNEIEQLQLDLSKLDILKEKTNSLIRLYNDLESKFNIQQLEWMRWKQGWLSQKQCYLQRIRDLQKFTQKNYY